MIAAGCRLAAFLGVCAALPLPSQAAEAKRMVEYEIQAGYLYNFAKFVEWPSSAFASTESPFVIVVVDGGEASSVLERIFDGKKVGSHPVHVKKASATALPTESHILFVSRESELTPEQVYNRFKKTATLVVGETEKFAERGGIVGFTREDDSIRLTLNLERAAEAGLKVDAKLSSVAKVVKSTHPRNH